MEMKQLTKIFGRNGFRMPLSRITVGKYMVGHLGVIGSKDLCYQFNSRILSELSVNFDDFLEFADTLTVSL